MAFTSPVTATEPTDFGGPPHEANYLFSLTLTGDSRHEKGSELPLEDAPARNLGHAATEANTNPTTATAKPAKPITIHPLMPSCQGSPRRSLAAAVSSTSVPATITHIAPTTNKPTPVKYHSQDISLVLLSRKQIERPESR
jgi:hypothetical protein